jgi:hypothetical protein
MNRRQRLINMLKREQVDRPAVNFYEIGGFVVDPNDINEFNVFNSPSWRPLLELAETQTDIIRMIEPKLIPASQRRNDFYQIEESFDGRSKFTQTILNVGGKTMRSLARVDKDVHTVWQIEHLLKNSDELKAFLQLPIEVFNYAVDVSNLVSEEEKLSERGIVMVDTPDPLCMGASLFSMEDFTIIALTEQALFTELLAVFSEVINKRIEAVSKAFPGHLWRIYGPEYATPPYLPPALFDEYVVKYDSKIVDIIHKYDGYARIHAHGNVRAVLPMVVEMGADAIDPVEPAPQGDVELDYVIKEYGKDIIVFGNLEITDIENKKPAEFEKIVQKSLEQGTSSNGRGFVLMPSASPYGREISDNVLQNYKLMVELIKNYHYHL